MSLLVLVPAGLVLVAEAAWIAVFAALLDAFALHAPVTGVPLLLLAAAGGMAASRTLGSRLESAWPLAAVGLTVLAGALGWLASPEVRDILATGGAGSAGSAFAANPGGWLASLAVVRGMAHARLPVDPQRVGTMLAAVVPGLALAAILGGMVAEPWRGLFLAAAQLQVLLFLATGILALALSRLAQVDAFDLRADWRRNPAWVALVAVLVLATAAAALVVSVVVGRGIALTLWALLVPALLVGFIVGFDRRSLRIVLLSVALAAVLTTILRLLGSAESSALPVTAPPVAGNGQPEAGNEVALGIVVIVLAVGVVGVLVLARLWVRRSPAGVAADDEVRVIDHGGALDGPARPRRATRFRRRAKPLDAVAAYRALIDDLQGRPPVARGPSETPAEHAARLRADGHGSLALDLLAADYGLARFGGGDLTAVEHRRAVGRAGKLRRALHRVPARVPLDQAREAGAAQGGEDGAPRGVRGGHRGTGPGADMPGADQPGALGSILTRIRRGP